MKTSILLAAMLALVSCTKKQGASSGPLQADQKKEERLVPHPGDLTKAVVKNDLDMVRKLIQAGANVDENTSTNPEHRITPLMAAVVMGHSSIAFELLRVGAESYSRYDGFSSRDFAIYNEEHLERSVRDALVRGEAVLKAPEKAGGDPASEGAQP